MLWTILDTATLTTEFVLFGHGVGSYVRFWVTEESDYERPQILEHLVWVADRTGVQHDVRLPRFDPITCADGDARIPDAVAWW